MSSIKTELVIIGLGKLMMIDAYYQCFKQRDSLDYVLSQFRKYYPSSHSKIVLVNDGGDDFLAEAKQYDCEYSYKENVTKNTNLVFSKDLHLFEYVNRMSEGCERFTNEYFILLEDDVLLMKRLSLDSLKNDINCGVGGEHCLFDDGAAAEIRTHNEKLRNCYNIWYGACGGSVFRTEFMVNLLRDKDMLKKEAALYCSLSSKEKWASDAFLSYLCLKTEGALGQYSGFCETWYPDYLVRKQTNDIEVLHQYKELYT